MILKTPEDFKRLVNQFKSECEFVAIRYVEEASNYYNYRNEKPRPTSQNQIRGAMIEVHEGGCIGYAATNLIHEAGLQSAFYKARSIARNTKSVSTTLFPSSQIRPLNVGYYSTLSERDSLSLTSINSFLKKANQLLKNNKSEIISSSSSIFDISYNQIYISSIGSEIIQNFQRTGINLMATSQRGSETQYRSYFGGLADCKQQSLSTALDEEKYFDACGVISAEAIELLDAEDCPKETADLILMPDQMMLQIHESIGHPLELDRIIGDERNFAGSSFVQLEDIGKLQYGSSIMNVTFDPSVESELATYKFDDNGCKAKREFLIQDGKLVRTLGGLESQYRTGAPGVANARSCSWNRAPIDRMANLNLEPGQANLDDMISSVQNGVLMHSNRSWSIDDFRNKFQFGCEYAKKIENGKITKTLKNPNYRGQTISFWNNLKMVGDSSTMGLFGTFFCGKGEPSQTINVGHRSPICLFSNVEVFGGHN